MKPAAGSDSVRSKLLELAYGAIRKNGLKRLTIVGVAAEAGMTHANVYRYFSSKIAIAETIVADWLRQIEQRLNEISQAPDPAHDKLERFVTYLARAYEEKARNEPEIFVIFVGFSEKNNDEAARHRRRIRELLLRIIEEGIATRLFSGENAQRLQRIVWDMMYRFIDPYSVQRTVGRQGISALSNVDARRDLITRILLRELGSNRR